jgi:hypothetical protein
VLPWCADSNCLDQNLEAELSMDKSDGTRESHHTSTADILARGKTLPQYAAAIIGKY